MQSGVITENDVFDISVIRSMLCDRFAPIDYNQAKQDVIPFIRDTSTLDIWCKEFFTQITMQLN